MRLNTITIAAMKTHHFIFGYGSLVCSKSRKITAPTLTKPAHPVSIEHLRRSWTARVPTLSNKNGASETREEMNIPEDLFHGQTAMGIERARGHKCTGVLIEVNATELKQFDKREKGYDRVEIELHHVYPISENHEDDLEHIVLRTAHDRRSSSKDDTENNKDEDDHEKPLSVAKVWVYLPKQGTPANHKYPIMQSYVDIIVRGCLGISEEFTRKFLETTHGWWHDDHDGNGNEEDSGSGSGSPSPQYIWVDDRHAPYYIRADEEWSKEMKHIVDQYLHESQAESFKKRMHLDRLESNVSESDE